MQIKISQSIRNIGNLLHPPLSTSLSIHMTPTRPDDKGIKGLQRRAHGSIVVRQTWKKEKDRKIAFSINDILVTKQDELQRWPADVIVPGARPASRRICTPPASAQIVFWLLHAACKLNRINRISLRQSSIKKTCFSYNVTIKKFVDRITFCI